jgi:hypothetical protein
MVVKGGGGSRIDTVFVLLIFCVFAVSVFLVLMLSGSTYKNMNDIAADGQNERIAMSYIRTKVRKTDTLGSVSVGDFGGVRSLMLTEDLGGRFFVTRIYYYDGWLYELFHETDNELTPEDGVPVIQIGGLEIDMSENGLLNIRTAFGEVSIFPRSSARREGHE